MKYKVGDVVRIISGDKLDEMEAKGIGVYPMASMIEGLKVEIIEAKDEFYRFNVSSHFMFSEHVIEGLVEEETKVDTALNPIELKSNANCLTQEMFEGLVEEENNHITETVVDTVRESNDRYRIVIDPRFDIEVDEGEYYAVRRKKEYPKTYEECCKVLSLPVRDLDILDNMLDTTEIVYNKNLDRLLNSFRKLLICRDAYWKIAGDELGLGKPWEPGETKLVYPITRYGTQICIHEEEFGMQRTFEFPTEEMRDMFYENFKEEIEQCKKTIVMALTREQIEYGEIRKFFSQRKSRYRKYLKKCMNKWLRNKAKEINLEDENIPIKKEYKGWEF